MRSEECLLHLQVFLTIAMLMGEGMYMVLCVLLSSKPWLRFNWRPTYSLTPPYAGK